MKIYYLIIVNRYNKRLLLINNQYLNIDKINNINMRKGELWIIK